MNQIIKNDLYRYIGTYNVKYLLRFIFLTPGFRYIFFMRKCSFAKNSFSKFLWLFLLRQCSLRCGIQIPYNTKIDKGFRIVHFGHIVINPEAIIGKNFNISQGCTIGNSQGKKKGTPIIGDNVFMQPNSVIVGNIKIGNNVLIAPNAFVNFDVPDNSIVIGNPGTILSKTNPTDKYIVYSI